MRQRFINRDHLDDWIYSSENIIIEELNYGKLLEGSSTSRTITAQYKGWDPIRVNGLFIKSIPKEFYEGNNNPAIDLQTILRWADDFTGEIESPGKPGIEIIQTHWETGLPVIDQVTYGTGDSVISPVPYVGHKNGYLLTDDTLKVTLTINIPEDLFNMYSSSYLHLAFDISYQTLNESLFTSVKDELC